MFIIVLVVTLLFACYAARVDSKSYDWSTGNTSVWLSAAAYCDSKTYLSRSYKGYSSGFVATYSISNVLNDVQGFVGYLSSKSQIYVVYRGSTSIIDWLDDLDAILTTYPSCSKCEVHKGFYSAEQAVIASVLSNVQSLIKRFPSYEVVVSGHSLGAALATLTAMDFLSAGITNVRLFHFGSPRVGNTAFANYASSKLIDHNRNTHYKDIVPHCPMHERFTHISGEWYEKVETFHSLGDLVECQGNEDPSCSYQWSLTSIDDHMHYLGLYVGCNAVSK